MKIEILHITPEETWDLRNRVMWPDKPVDYVKLEEDQNGLHFGLEVEGSLVSIISVFINSGKAQFRKFATDATQQGMGYGSQLLQFVIEDLIDRGVTSIWCNAREEKTGFYEKFGLRKTDKTFVKGGIDYVIMEKKVEDNSLNI
ncbi:GNAT family N-acetyltransferase [Echinicola sp. CAU 1574]|uniref:GNAT family N-acetyltransferase n=1 Tax=Echinicola arenosa TaxID=2774144 RepID=A0ABR9AJ40_9BACT|nr:GNAT family N-acetyltransferase [Echinicola arenosa]MBD8488847.1 GNAT family N-acetyltransferase [Echinicola arenosa]